jgi:hypothetical protein
LRLAGFNVLKPEYDCLAEVLTEAERSDREETTNNKSPFGPEIAHHFKTFSLPGQTPEEGSDLRRG